MSKTVEVLFRMQGVKIPRELPIERVDRDDAILKRQREQGLVLPGKKVFQTHCDTQKGWRLKRVKAGLRQAGYGIAQINVELREDPSGGARGSKEVLSIGFEHRADDAIDPDVLAWIENVVMQMIFRLGMAYLNPLARGGSQLVYDLCGPTKSKDQQADLPLQSFLNAPSQPGATVGGNSPQAETSLA